MTKYHKGDKIRVSIRGTDESKTIWLAEEDDNPGVLFTYHGLDPFAPNVLLDELLSDLHFEVTVETPFSESLPTVPGEYEDRIRDERRQVFAEVIEQDEELKELMAKPWVLNEDGTWTAPDGTSEPAESNWLLTVAGFEFFPWEERTR